MPSAMPLEPVSEPAPSLIAAAARGNCPACAGPTLFEGAVRFAPVCRTCGLSFGQFNVGDGPAAFLTLAVGAIMMAMALTLELKVHPPIWVHLLLWTPLTLAAVVASLRIAKAMLLILEYRNKAREGRIVQGEQQP